MAMNGPDKEVRGRRSEVRREGEFLLSSDILFERTPGSVDENGRRERITSGTESSAAIVVRYRYPISHSTENSEQRSGGRTDF